MSGSIPGADVSEQDDNAPTLISERVDRSRPSSRPLSKRSAPPPSLASAPPAGSTAPGMSLTATAAIVEEQRARGRAIVRVGFFVGGASALLLQLPVEQDPTGKLVATIALVAICAASAALMVMEALGRPINPRHVFWLSNVITPSVIATMWHVGVLSPTVMAMIFGIYYFGLSDRKIEGWTCYLMSTVGFGVLVTLTATGVLRGDQALFPLVNVDPVAVAGIAVVVEMMLAMTFWLARLSRKATLEAMAKLETAQRQIRERDVLLDEVAQDFQMAAGLGKRGRYSGRKIGEWVAEEVIGRGAMGEVYRGRAGEREAAVKVLHPFYLESKHHLERFFREAQVSGALQSPHIVEVLASGVTDDGAPYLAMELLVGHDLAWHLRQRRRFTVKETLRLVGQLAQALSVAQDEGIVHRDLKPKNVFLDERPERQGSEAVWKVLDFGVSKIHATSGTLTHGDIVGTPGYMAPEQAKAVDVDHRADVFSLGAIAYRVLTGRPAFPGDRTMQVLYRVAATQPARPSSIVKLPDDVDLVLALALAKDRDRRLRSATTFAAALRDAARGDLDQRFRDDANALLAAQPWGSGGEDAGQED